MRPDNFCYAPWSGLEIMQSGKILPCCKFMDEYYDRRYNITQDTVDDYRNSKYLAEIKQEFLNGQWPRGCERCKLEEESHIKSKRQLDYDRWQDKYATYDINSNECLSLGIAFGNTCNLKCIICHPSASSKWQKEYSDLYGVTFPIIESFRKPVINSITSLAPNLMHIDIYGGEPFLSGIAEHEQLLDYYIASGQAKEITIHYTTNGTLWPGESWFSRWQHFKEIDLQISIDGIEERFGYLRFPAKWSDLEHNVQQYISRQSSNFRLSVAHTVSAFNVYYLDEFISWCHAVGLPKPWLSRLHKPEAMRANVWPREVREVISQHLRKSRWPEVKNWARLILEDGPDRFEEFCDLVSKHDRYRKLDYRIIFPEMAQYI